ncbi:unnamed protein product [Dovyalis caffra]|uniref:Uncharacterized protein n=1 Tax=Dovyalis caffra TaxID=77055 RepID=A0AAV1RFL2_9ROSI|nr:unnamed protein product [Dovyalis caffra]
MGVSKRGSLHPFAVHVKMRMVAKTNGLSEGSFQSEDIRFKVGRRARESTDDGVVKIDIEGVGNGGEDRISIGREAERRVGMNESAKEEVSKEFKTDDDDETREVQARRSISTLLCLEFNRPPRTSALPRSIKGKTVNSLVYTPIV